MSDKTPGFGSGHFSGSGHICLIFESDEQRRRTVAEYLAAGLRGGELVRYFADQTPPDTVRSWLEQHGPEARAAEQRGAFSITPAEGAYCPGGRFDPEALIAGLKQRYGVAEQAGYRGMRSTGEMSWVLRGVPGSGRFLEYEALLNTIDSPFPHSGMCQYDARRFDGATLFKVLQLHPLMVAEGQIVQNPHYTRPEAFLSRAGPQAG